MANDNQIAVKKRLIYAEDLFEPVDFTVLQMGGRGGGKTMAMYEQLFRERVEMAPTIDALPLRCHIGDTVWIVGTKCMSGLHDNECPDKNEWNSFDDFCEDCPLDREYIVFPRTVNGYNFAHFHELDPECQNPLLIWGETVFKTQEEAEAALAKMKEADHD